MRGRALVLVLVLVLFWVSAVHGSSFDGTAQTRILAEHNRARGDAAPAPATRMQALTWSSAAASQANTWANQCQYRHSYAAGFGENIFAGSGYRVNQYGQSVTSDQAFAGWEEEESGFAFDSNGNVVCTHPQTCGHYTQIVWANTARVGCAWAQCSTNSPFGASFPTWTFVVCNYEAPGNVVGQKPYVPVTGTAPSPSPSPSRSRVVSPSPSRTRTPAALSATPTRSPSRSLTRTPTRSVVVAGVTPTRTPTRTRSPATAVVSVTPSRTRSPVAVASVTPTRTRTPSRSRACSCGQNMQCMNNVCTCLTGYTLVAGQCVLPTSGGTPSWASDFSQQGVGGMTIPDVVLVQQSAGSNLVRWDRSAGVVNKYTTRHNLFLQATTGTFALAFRVGQSSGAGDRVEFRWSGLTGSIATMQWCLVYGGADYCTSFGSRSFPSASGLALKSTMGYDDAAGNLVCTVTIGSSVYSGYTAGANYPALGALGYFFNMPSSTARPALSELTLATSSTLTVSLTDCIDDAEWQQMFYALTGANPATTQVQVRASGQNANCKEAAASSTGKALVSGFTFVVTSTSVPAQALASTLVASVGSPAAEALGVSSAGVVAGSQGAALAGVPSATSALPGTVVSASVGGGGAAATGGAGGSGGLSGGAIAGIVIGSVAGAVLLVGVSALLVGAVIVGAVVLTRSREPSSSSASSSPSDERARSLRQTIRGFFGGVDVMNNPHQGHQSITARSPPMQV